jgi:hypothetical protein
MTVFLAQDGKGLRSMPGEQTAKQLLAEKRGGQDMPDRRGCHV